MGALVKKPKVTSTVDVYQDGKWNHTIYFKSKFWAFVFHIALNNSLHHAGVRNY